MSDALAECPDGLTRCWWAASATDYAAYHDREWGRPVTSDEGLFERLSLEAFQSGLSWLTILRKREAFRAAFAGFRIEAVAAFGSADVQRLLGDAGIVRNRAKITATIENARAAARLAEHGGSLARLVWSHLPGGRRAAPRTRADLPRTVPESVALARALGSRGFRFVGPTTAYALMQACGLVNDHVAGCCMRADVERERREALARMRA